jgi:hypothetical protein
LQIVIMQQNGTTELIGPQAAPALPMIDVADEVTVGCEPSMTALRSLGVKAATGARRSACGEVY